MRSVLARAARSTLQSIAMTAFIADECKTKELDWTILRDGGISLYCRSDFLAEDIAWLGQKGYRVSSFNTAEWKSEDQMHDSLKDSLGFPDYYGRNLDALDECLCEDMAVPETGGLALVFLKYDRFAKVLRASHSFDAQRAEVVLDGDSLSPPVWPTAGDSCPIG